nr:unnamed protein product [Digitaria exilis]
MRRRATGFDGRRLALCGGARSGPEQLVIFFLGVGRGTEAKAFGELPWVRQGLDPGKGEKGGACGFKDLELEDCEGEGGWPTAPGQPPSGLGGGGEGGGPLSLIPAFHSDLHAGEIQSVKQHILTQRKSIDEQMGTHHFGGCGARTAARDLPAGGGAGLAATMRSTRQ